MENVKLFQLYNDPFDKPSAKSIISLEGRVQ